MFNLQKLKKGSRATWVIRLEPTPAHRCEKDSALILIPKRNGIYEFKMLDLKKS